MEKIILNIIGFCIGLGLLIWGSEYLIQSSVRLAYILRWSPLFIGLILISFGTSAPEGSIGIIAALKQEKGIALGNVIGSNIANIALVLGICSMVKPIVVDRRLFSLNIPLMLISYIVFYIFCIDLVLTPFEGIILLTIFCFFCLYAYKHSSLSIEESKGIQDFKFSNFIKSIRSKSLLFLLVLVFLISIVGGANIMVNTGKNLAQILGVSKWVIGVTVFAIGTSLPELGASFTANVKRVSSISVGNIVGSNIFNILFILGVVSLITPLRINPSLLIFELPVMLFFGLFFIFFRFTNYRITRKMGLVLFLAYVIFIFLLVKINKGAISV